MRENKSSHACSQRELSEEKGVSPSDKNGYFTERSSLVVIMEHRQGNLFGLRDPDLTLQVSNKGLSSFQTAFLLSGTLS